MKLKKLEIYGFKSFADRTEIDFGQGITGIVGPNGSGKSNLSDAVRWALGEQSAKQLRGAKMEDIIFSGTEKRKPASWCEVVVTLDNDSETLAMPTSEIAITRRVYRNGASETSINRATCRMKDVVDLLRDTGIGREGYSIISQGRIDEILSVKPEERRAVFEEAAGITKYRARKDEAIRSLDKAEANLVRVVDTLSVMSERLDVLAEQSAKARTYFAVANRLKTLELNVYLIEETQSISQLKTLAAAIDEHTESKRTFEDELASLTLSRDENEKLTTDTEATIASLQADELSISKEIERMQGDAQTLTVMIGHADEEAARLTRVIESYSNENDTHGAAIVTLRDELVVARTNLDRAALAKTNTDDALSEAKEHEREAGDALDAHKNKTIDMMNRIADANAQGAKLAAMKQAWEEQSERLAAERESLNAQESRLVDEIGADERLKSRHSERLAEIARLSGEQAALISSIDAAREKHTNAMRDESDKLRAATTRLSVLRDLRDSMEGYQYAVKHALKTPNEPGIVGIVADIMRSPREYETAIEMTLGGAMQNIVTEDEQTAKRVIEHLRRNSYGRATFLPLTTVRGRTLSFSERGALSVSGCLGVASELVSYDEKYRGIVESLLGRTVIASDMESGLAIMKKCGYAFRTVTLAGDIINPGGSMTGGSTNNNSNHLLSRAREIETLERNITILNERMPTYKQKLAELDEKRTAILSRQTERAEQTRQTELEVARIEARLQPARETLNEVRLRIERINADAARIDESQRDADSRIEQSKHTGLEDAETQTKMQAETVRLTDIKIEAKKLVDALIEEAQRARESCIHIERDIEQKTRDIARLEAAAKSASQSIETSKTALERVNASRIEYEVRLVSRQADKVQAGERLALVLANLKKQDVKLAELRQSLRDIAAKEIKVRGDLNSVEETLHRTQLALTRAEEERKARNDRIWNTYELTYAGALEHKDDSVKHGRETDKIIAALKEEIRSLGSINAGAVEEYDELKRTCDTLEAQQTDLTKARLDLEGVINDLTKKMEERFTEQLALLDKHFKETFAMLFGGGTASLSLADKNNALTCGIDVYVQPPGKKLSMLSLLSGGERAMTAIAILFAMLRLKPSPFCILDEIDSALDEANVSQFAEGMAEFARHTQFVVLTHRKGTMERCDALFGVTMAEKGVSGLMSVRMEEKQAV